MLVMSLVVRESRGVQGFDGGGKGKRSCPGFVLRKYVEDEVWSLEVPSVLKVEVMEGECVRTLNGGHRVG